MQKTLSAIGFAAFVAIVATVVSNPVPVDAGPVPVAQQAEMRACNEQPWPYNTCVGTRFGAPGVRMVTTDGLRSAEK